MTAGQLEAGSDKHQREDDPQQGGEQQLASAKPLHKEHPRTAGGQVGGRDDGRGPDGRRGGRGPDAGHADNGGRVVHEGVDTGGLLEHLQAAPDGQGSTSGPVL